MFPTSLIGYGPTGKRGAARESPAAAAETTAAPYGRYRMPLPGLNKQQRALQTRLLFESKAELQSLWYTRWNTPPALRGYLTDGRVEGVDKISAHRKAKPPPVGGGAAALIPIIEVPRPIPCCWRLAVVRTTVMVANPLVPTIQSRLQWVRIPNSDRDGHGRRDPSQPCSGSFAHAPA